MCLQVMRRVGPGVMYMANYRSTLSTLILSQDRLGHIPQVLTTRVRYCLPKLGVTYKASTTRVSITYQSQVSPTKCRLSKISVDYQNQVLSIKSCVSLSESHVSPTKSQVSSTQGQGHILRVRCCLQDYASSTESYVLSTRTMCRLPKLCVACQG